MLLPPPPARFRSTTQNSRHLVNGTTGETTSSRSEREVMIQVDIPPGAFTVAHKTRNCAKEISFDDDTSCELVRDALAGRGTRLFAESFLRRRATTTRPYECHERSDERSSRRERLAITPSTRESVKTIERARDHLRAMANSRHGCTVHTKGVG